jgi:hypothetical protein
MHLSFLLVRNVGEQRSGVQEGDILARCIVTAIGLVSSRQSSAGVVKLGLAAQCRQSPCRSWSQSLPARAALSLPRRYYRMAAAGVLAFPVAPKDGLRAPIPYISAEDAFHGSHWTSEVQSAGGLSSLSTHFIAAPSIGSSVSQRSQIYSAPNRLGVRLIGPRHFGHSSDGSNRGIGVGLSGHRVDRSFAPD